MNLPKGDSPALHAASTFGSGFEQLRAWALDEAHLVQSVRMHEPTYRNPGELRSDVRELLARFDALHAESAAYLSGYRDGLRD